MHIDEGFGGARGIEIYLVLPRVLIRKSQPDAATFDKGVVLPAHAF